MASEEAAEAFAFVGLACSCPETPQTFSAYGLSTAATAAGGRTLQLCQHVQKSRL